MVRHEVVLKFTVELKAGRLIEARVYALKTLEDVNEYSAAIAAAVGRAAGPSLPVLCADHRPVKVYSSLAADGLVGLFQRNNARLERAALILDPANATLFLQLDRIVREAKYERRKVFRDVATASEFLALGLDVTERKRAEQFLAEWRRSEP